MQGIFLPTFKTLGWDAKDNEPDEDKQKRALVLGALAKYKNKEVMAEAEKRFSARFFSDD